MSTWIEWKGGECPVPDGTRVQVKLEDGSVCAMFNAEWWVWSHDQEDGGNIVAYRVVE